MSSRRKLSEISTTVAVPEQGQIVALRQRRYTVTEVRVAEQPVRLPLSPSRFGTPASSQEPQHLVTATSVEDDALGEEIQVIWEAEIGAQTFTRLLLPSPVERGFDAPERLDAFLDAVRWGAASQADTRFLQAPFRSGIEIEDYQLDPLVRALQMPRVSLLIADDVGLGKTIEAGLVCQEMLLRHRARRMLIVCPSALQIQWQTQMREKFGLEFRLVDAELQRDLRRRRGLHVNPWAHFPRLITSMDFVKRERPLRLLRETLPADGQPTYPRKWDLLIVDEAHNIAPSGTGRYATDSQRTRALRELVPHVEHKLFLTATPHNGYAESFASLLELLDNQRFARGVAPDRAQLGAVMVRRLKSEMKDWKGESKFPRRVLEPLEVAYTDAERAAHARLQTYSHSRLQRAGDETERVASEFVLKLLKKRLFSSPAAFAATLETHERSLETARRGASGGSPHPAVSVLRQQIESTEEEFADDDQYEEKVGDTITATTRLFRETTGEERLLLQELRSWADQARNRSDSKAKALLTWLRTYLKPNAVWNDTRVILFTEYRATQKWLLDILAQEGFAEAAPGGGARLLQMYGGMASEERETVKAAFQADPAVSPVRILLATDAASEGIDLQNHCARLIHFEIPWNPNRMEQRNGRVDRHGQREAAVHIYHFVPKGFAEGLKQATGVGLLPGIAKPGALEGDLEFLARAAAKVEQIREDLGKVGPVIASQVEEAMFGRRTRLETEPDEAKARPIRELLKLQRRLDEEIRSFRERLDETRREMHFTAENTERIVSIGLQLAKQLPLQPATVPHLPAGARAYWLPALSGSWQECLEGILHPHTKQPRPIVFDHEAARQRDDVVLVHVGHRLVQMCLRLLRAEVWASESAGDGATRRMARVTARYARRDGLPRNNAPVALAHGRLLLLGSGGERLHEEVITAGGVLVEGRFERVGVNAVNAAIAATLPTTASERLRSDLVTLWPRHEKPLLNALEARAGERAKSLESTLAERAEREQADIEAILTELKRTIEESFATPDVDQLSLNLFSDTEREQFETNQNSLRQRLARIPAEIEREKEAIRRRFAAPQTRLFPIAVTYLLPEGLS